MEGHLSECGTWVTSPEAWPDDSAVICVGALSTLFWRIAAIDETGVSVASYRT